MNSPIKTNIAYIAPEINGLSSTFVYNEILSLEEHGFNILPFSVHRPKRISNEKRLTELNKRTYYLYEGSVINLISKNIYMLVSHPANYLRTFYTAIKDSIKIGITKRAGLGLIFRFFVASTVSQQLKKNNCLLLHSHFAHISTDIAMYASGIIGIPFSFTSHANDLFERGWLLKEKIDRAKFAITISEYNRNFLDKYCTDMSKVKVVRCGIESKLEMNKRKVNNNPPVIGSLGRLVEKKGFDVLILALRNLDRKGYDFKLEIAGAGPLMPNLKELTLKEGINSKVQFLGAISHETVYDWLNKLDIFILASKIDSNGDQDGIPVVLMEAMSASTPVISTSISAIPELIEDNVSGLLAEPGDVETLAGKLEIMICDKSKRRKFVKNGLAYIKEEFDLDLNTNRLKIIFQEMINARKKNSNHISR